MWSDVKAVAEKHLSSENIYIDTYILLAMVMMKWLCTYWPTIKKQTSLDKPRSKRKLFEKKFHQ